MTIQPKGPIFQKLAELQSKEPPLKQHLERCNDYKVFTGRHYP